MKISTKGLYAVRLMLFLADHADDGLIPLKRVSTSTLLSKKYLEQIRIAKDVVYSCNHNENIRSMVKGLMIESYLEDGCQKIGEHIYGKSITDPCLGWEKTERLILDIADTLR